MKRILLLVGIAVIVLIAVFIFWSVVREKEPLGIQPTVEVPKDAEII